ncbi:MAG: TonB-dependent receptor [Bacteroidales bacterium]|nr:TonB-dependent receptor [Bacteroidales bacterium]MBR5862569.1 TonB-dependent receptor [Bacteroidales bacterium]
MKRLFSALVAALCLMLTARAQDTDAHIHGHVIDRNTGEHLPYMVVILKGTTIGVSTESTGHYMMRNVPEGIFTVEVSSVGYKTQSREINISKGRSYEVNFSLEEDLVQIDGVIVSATRSETTRRMSPTLVNVVGMDVYNKANATTVAQGLAFQPGVRVENNCQNCGFQQVRINGLDGQYTQILIDSRPVFSALAGVYGIEQLPANMVDRVEVMRGGGSALFGSSAIAGTINIITKEPVRNSAAISHTTTAIGASGAFHNTTDINASIVSEDNKFGLAIFGQNTDKDAWDANGDGFTELSTITGQTLGFRGYVKTGLYSKVTAEYHHLQEFRRGGDNLGMPPHEAMIAEQTDHGINTGGIKFDWFSKDQKHRMNAFASVQHINRDSYYGAGKDPNAYGNTKDLTWVGGAQYIYKAEDCLFMPADLTVGLEYNEDYLRDKMSGYGRTTDQTVRIVSAYAQNEWKNSQWGILIGGRLDKHNLMDGLIFSPRANLRYNPSENINLRASYSYGFRAPQAFDEDLHIDNVGGTVSMIRLADDLRVEKSQSISVSADMYHSWGNWQGNVLVEGFFTDLDDVFALRELGFENGILIKERHNESGARVFGGNFEGKVAYKDILQVQLGVTAQSSEYKEARSWGEGVAATRKMFRTPDLHGYLTASYNPTKALTLAVTGTYTGNMYVEHHAGMIARNVTVKTPDFLDMGLKGSYDFKIYKSFSMQVNAGIQNIFNSFQKDFDSGADRDSGYMYGPTLPRTFFFGIKLSY